MKKPAEPLMRRLLPIAAEEVRATLARLPAPLREQAGRLLIDYDPFPDEEWVSGGVPADSMGVFDGEVVAHLDAEDTLLPPRVVLFLENIWEESERRERVFRKEVRQTLLHELGHFLGLEEDALEARGLG